MTLDLHTVSGALGGLIALCLLLIIWYGPWQRFCTDSARDVIFAQRDALFDIAASGHLAFGSASYETIRAALNAMIRLAHRLSLLKLVLVILAMRRARLDLPRSNLRQALELISDRNARDQAAAVVAEAERALLAMLLMRSPGFVFLLLPLLALVIVRLGLRGALEIARRLLTGQIESAVSMELRGAR